MATNINTYNFFPVKTGTTTEDTTINITVNGTAFNFAGCEVTMHVKPNAQSEVVAESLSSANGDFTISGTDLVLVGREITLRPNKYYYDILIKKTGGEYKIYIEGTITVLAAITTH